MDSQDVVNDFRNEHRHIEEQLAACDGLTQQPGPLTARLKEMRAALLAHFDKKDTFYLRLHELCAMNGDLASSNISHIFADSMKVQSGAIRRFFEALDNAPSPLLGQSFVTIAMIVRSRLSTEERAVFPLYEKNIEPRGKVR